MTDIVREIAFDTETTGLNWDKDDRIIELGAVELVNHIPTGRTFQAYVNPGRPVSEATTRITGLTDADLTDKPPFEAPEIVNSLLEFIGDANLVAHNASFDRGFLNMELSRCGLPEIKNPRWIDTLAIARQKFPGAPASLDALCRRFEINAEARTYHGALLDSQLLAEVYLELLGGRARAFDFGTAGQTRLQSRAQADKRPEPLVFQIPQEEMQCHSDFIDSLGEAALWRDYA